MRCDQLRKLIPDYLDNQLSIPLREEVVGHLAACEECQEEADGYRCALGALGRVGRQPAPDLWQSFQSRLQAEGLSVQCDQVRAELPAWVDGLTVKLEPRLVREHLRHCVACAAEEQALAGALRQMERAPAPAPDLWSSFGAQLARSVSCAEVESRLAAYLAGERDVVSLALDRHLEQCASCAAAATASQRALTALNRAGRSAADVDLWPRLLARLESPRARRIGWTERVSAWISGGAGNARVAYGAMAAAALLVAVVAGRLVLPHPAPHSPLVQTPTVVPERVARVPAPVVTRPPVRATTGPTPSLPARRLRLAVAGSPRPRVAATRHRRHLVVTGASRRNPAVRTPQPMRLASAQLPRVPEAAGESAWTNHLEVSFDVTSGTRAGRTEAGAPPTEREEKKVEAEVLHAVEMLVHIDDAVRRPFETNADEK